MKQANEIRRIVNKKFQQKQNRITALPGRLGNGNGVLNVPGLQNWVYVRIASTVTPVYNNRVLPENDLLVMVGYDSTQPDLFQVLSTRTAQPGGAYGGAFSGPPPAIRYQWMAPGGGQDPLWVELRQFMHLRIGAKGGMLLQIYRGIIWTGTGFALVDTQNINLSEYIPTTTGNAALVLITISDSGAVVATKGSEFVLANMTTPAQVLAQIPAVPTGTRHILGYVRVWTGQTAIQEARTNTDIADLRFSGWGGSSEITTIADHDHSGDPGDGGAFDAANLTSGTAADGYVLTADGDGGAAWEVPAGGGSGDVTGPSSATDGHLAVFDGTTGKLIKDGGAGVDIGSDSANITAVNFEEQSSAPAAPGTGHRIIYSKSDGLYIRDSAGLDVGPLGTGNSAVASRWEVLTNGDAAAPEIIYANGDVIMVEILL